MREFTITEDGLKKIKKRILIRIILLSLIIGICGFLIIQYRFNDDNDPFFPFFLAAALITSMTFSITRSIKVIMEQMKSFKLSVSDNVIKKEAKNTPIIALSGEEIKQIIKLPNRNFFIQGKDYRNLIIVPSNISDDATLEPLLKSIAPIRKANYLFYLTFTPFLFFPILPLLAIIFLTKNNTIMVICAIITITLLIRMWLFYRKNKLVDNRTKRRSGIILLLIFFIVVYVVSKLLEINLQ